MNRYAKLVTFLLFVAVLGGLIGIVNPIISEGE